MFTCPRPSGLYLGCDLIQTFLPFANFERSAASLDQRRLGKQRVETLQIMKALTDPDYGWQNHPAVKMWRTQTCALFDYQEAVCNEWRARGYQDTCLTKTWKLLTTAQMFRWRSDSYSMPPWLGDDSFHLSHRSNLVRKDGSFYVPQFGPVNPDLDYVWPV